jgi:hypothetical protein
MDGKIMEIISFATKLKNPPHTSSSLDASQKEVGPTLRIGLVSLMSIRMYGMKRKRLKTGRDLRPEEWPIQKSDGIACYSCFLENLERKKRVCLPKQLVSSQYGCD